MRAARYHEYGTEQVLVIEETELPTPSDDEVLVKVAATSFNPIDAAIRAGYLQSGVALEFPHTPGIDVAGVVVRRGANVTAPAVGDAVVAFLPLGANGATAEFVLAPSDAVAAAPTNIPLADAAAVPAVGLTAWQALFEHADLRFGQRILINGAGGAVGGYAIQLASQAGAFVIATASPRSTDSVRRRGADQIVDHTTTLISDAVSEQVDAVLNLARTSTEESAALLALIRPGGVFVTTVPPAPISTGGVRIVEMYVRGDASQLTEIVAKIDAGQLRVDVANRVSFAEIASIHEASDLGILRGKVVLTPVP
jgi:NADPH:quinone reductase-like Zn-dependent oxidoreductase